MRFQLHSLAQPFYIKTKNKNKGKNKQTRNFQLVSLVRNPSVSLLMVLEMKPQLKRKDKKQTKRRTTKKKEEKKRRKESLHPENKEPTEVRRDVFA